MNGSTERYVSDGDQEIWAVVVESRRRSGLFWPGWLLAVVLLLGACLLGSFGIVAAIAIFVAIRSDPTRLFETDGALPLLRYRRVRLDAHGIRVDWLDEMVGPVSDEMLLTAPGQREQRIDWEDIAHVELAAAAVVLITDREGTVRALSLGGVTQAVYERLMAVWSGKQRGASTPDETRARRAQLERLRSRRDRDG